MKRPLLILLVSCLALSASAEVLISSKGTVGPPGGAWTFAEIAGATGTSGSCVGSDCMIQAKGANELEGAMLSQTFLGGNAQIIACFAGFTGIPGNFSAAGVGIGQSVSPLTNWSRIIKRQVGRIVGRYMPATGEPVIGTQGDDDADTEPCLAVTLDSQHRFQAFATPDATGDPLGNEWRLVQSHQGAVTVSAPYLVYLWCLSNDAAVTVGCPFTNVQVSQEITIQPPRPPECSDGVDNIDPEDAAFPLIDADDPGCGDPYDPLDNDERDTPLPEAQCDDGEDNDGDGDTDHPADAGCTGPTDDTENSENDDPCVIDPESCGPGGQFDLDFAYQGAWSTSDVNRYGWYFAYPSSVVTNRADHGGIFAGNNRAPGGFQGRRLKNVQVNWRDVEPTDQNFNWGPTITKINADSGVYDGVLFELVGLVTTARKPCGSGEDDAYRTAPDFLADNPAVYPQINEGCNSTADAEITQLKMDDTQLLQQYRAMTASAATAGVLSNTRLEASILHAAGSTSGEEFTGNQKNECLANGTTTNCGVDAWACTHGNDQDCILDSWFDAYGGNNPVGATNNAWKGGLVTDQPDSLYDRWIGDLNNGFGFKGYNIEFWLGGASHGDEQSLFGWIWEANGHGHIDENHLIHSSVPPRHFQTQNENYCKGEGNLTTDQFNPRRYRYAIFRALAMHFTIVWIEGGSKCDAQYSDPDPGKKGYVNPKLTNWMGLQLGHTVDTANTAWVVMLQTWRWGPALEEVNNLERYLYQYDKTGENSTPVLRVPWGFQPNGVKWSPGKQIGPGEIPEANREGYLARQGAVLGITVDDDFMEGNNGGAGFDVAMLISYFDDNNDPWTMEYTSSVGGGTTVKTVDEVPGAGNQQETPASRNVRTQQFCLGDFTAPASGTATDFRLKSPGGVTPFMMVQLDKTTAGCN